MTRWIVYACPTGLLGEQIEAYFAQTLTECGPNRAHDYMPHCTLTGFFPEEVTSVNVYIAALERAFARELQSKSPDDVPPILTITGMTQLPEWIGLTIAAPEVERRIAEFARLADSPTRPEALRRKTNLHVSLAYEFPPEQFTRLATLASETIDLSAPVGWELRLYERHPDATWVCHYARPLLAGNS